MNESNFSYSSYVQNECCSSAVWCHVTYYEITNILYLQLVTCTFDYSNIVFFFYSWLLFSSISLVLFSVVWQIFGCAISYCSPICCVTSHRLWLVLRYRTAFHSLKTSSFPLSHTPSNNISFFFQKYLFATLQVSFISLDGLLGLN